MKVILKCWKKSIQIQAVWSTLTNEIEELKKKEGLIKDLQKHFKDNEEQLPIENEGLKEEVRLLR